ncbi:MULTISPECIES: ATP-dependent 6-phosphofructokinase [unclassified Tolypothrix]|uniref:ATP-dependent 6-phosphofructokinase n=1 Tax=unclassified Tolypothrix TaxID=2649714 RepID=UPI0005EAB920|nr:MULTISPECIES: ATP-dependent 6-phosphofructokinase [unclassified Tolypothrix]BAY88132.1 6-phosphofructokinase [Microchaete diplosiphon NIES-3275]EKF01974.1 phosphofructokinase [Tolypothrix sp. PCC 7601]MBE9085870.1 ATP-dependent 6-phosphofructokinase [Tolypothrix sp. LEGE 11397]UYD28838.1 ATP-dependent 6-phosphofructokinase [Tolypothrix sp. PCC 7712]UYD35251.1 ATP-dependent 6-phosphofructokinase [Tolypothrix sp. PCC 7601]
MKTQKRLGILTSGGDCPGLNTVIRAVVSNATLTYDWQVLGIPYATKGLLETKAIPLSLHCLDLRGIDPLLSMGGTILGSINQGDTMTQIDDILAGYQALELDALIGIGGDGSLGILNELSKKGNWQFIGIPKTIDNDVALTERVVGFDTAVNTVVDALNRLTYTAASHDRVMIVEVMGRTAGHLALHSGIAGGADVILIPEIPYTIKDVCDHLRLLRNRWGRRFAIIVVAEGAKTAIDFSYASCGQPTCGIGQQIAEEIRSYSNQHIDIRVSVLGHIQRGGIPSALDRLIATAFGKAAVDLVANGQSGKMVAWQNNEVVAFPLETVLSQSPALVDPNNYLVQTARSLGIYIGNPTIQSVEESPYLSCC